VGRERTRRFIEGVILEAHVELTPAQAWLLGRADGGTIASEVLEVPDPGDRVALGTALTQLDDRDLVDSPDPPARLTASGQAIRRDLVDARRRSLEYLVADWHPEDRELDAMIARLSEELAQTAGSRASANAPAARSA
jgi:hypothetical protein